MLRMFFFFYSVEYIFSFDFSVRFEGNNKYAKKVLSRHGMRWRCTFHIRCVTNKIMFTLQIDFAIPEATVMNLIAFTSISFGLRQMKWIILLFRRREFRDQRED